MTLLREVIDIPEHVGEDDYVLKLTEGVAHADETIQEYVVTPPLAGAFDRALGAVATAVSSGRSNAKILWGSFGSGKSHFMAVLHALLGGSPAARRIPDLQETIARHDATLQGRRVVRLSYHLIGARSLEDAILGGYARQIAELHPEAPLPEVHRSERLFEDADRYRKAVGDESFFDGLTGDDAASSVWGSFAPTWTAESYERARAAPVGDKQRQQLVSALTRSYFQGYPQAGEYVEIDTGLRVLTAHAKQLGYDAVVLFLDELILWLASHLPDQDFVANEGSKIAKLVESAEGHRDVPIVSFVAQQRNLADFLGGTGPGNEQAAVADAFRWTEGRFDQIVLGDENLPYIVQKRLLQPKSDWARGQLDEAFRRLDRRPDVWNTLLDGMNTSEGHRGSDEEAFRRTFPFSPALVSTLRAVASMMQRERTALKVMQQILVDQRDELTIDDVIPVGDVFEYIATGREAISQEFERHFDSARKLYLEKLRPLLLREHGLREEQAADSGYRSAFRNDDRLVKTLLLAALAPDVPALRDLDARRIAALNHGTISSPLPGQESVTVLAKLGEWQREVPEIQLTGDSASPAVSVRLAEVDYESVLDRASHIDSMGERRRLLRERVWEALGLRRDDNLYGIQTHQLIWRGARKNLEIVYGNVRDERELPDDRLVHNGDDWRVVIDFPFDEAGYYPSTDVARAERLVSSGVHSNTLCWVPRFLSRERRDDLGRLVVLEYLLGGNGERFDSNADHLSATEKAQARAILETLRESTRARLDQALLQAYGARPAQSGDIDTGQSHDNVLVPLRAAFTMQEPVGASLGEAFRDVADQLLRATLPDHPDFRPGQTPVRSSELDKVLSYVQQAREEPNGRVPVSKTDRPVLERICAPLELGALYENNYVLDPATGFPWRGRIAQEMGKAGADGPVTVRQVRGWLDPDGRRGLSKEVAALVIAAWAVVTDRSWWRYGEAKNPAIKDITDDMELRQQPLPEPDEWERAVDRGGLLFGAQVTKHLSVRNLDSLVRQVRGTAQMQQRKSADLAVALETRAGSLGLDPAAATGRVATARAVADLLQRLVYAADGPALVHELATFEAPASDTVLSRALSTIDENMKALHDDTKWDLLDSVRQRDEARPILQELADVVAQDEFESSLPQALDQANQAALRLIRKPPPGGQDDGGQRVQPGGRTAGGEHGEHGGYGEKTIGAGRLDEAVDELREFARDHEGRSIKVTWRVEP